MLFAVVLGVMLGAAAVLLIQQWREDALTEGPRRVRRRPPLDGLSQPTRRAA